MRDISCPDAPRPEAVELSRNDADGSISLSLSMTPNGEYVFDDVLSLLSCWWLRWVVTIDCDFHYDGNAWHVHCHLQLDTRRVLPQVLRDLLTIKSVVCS